jgi:hypothetical protein
MKQKIIVFTAVIFVFFLIWTDFNYPRKPFPIAQNVPCIDPYRALVQHIHTHLKITVDQKEEVIPAEIGISSYCLKTLHTHETDGIIHMETQDDKIYTLGLFMDIWGKPLERQGQKLETRVNGSIYSGNPKNIALKENEEIWLAYTSTNK